MSARARDAQRHRRSEVFAPRPSDLIADRLRLLAEWAVRRGAVIELEGVPFDGPKLSALANAQSLAERELTQRWKDFRSFYEAFGRTRDAHEKLLLAAIAELDKLKEDTDARRTARYCKLRKPPLAKVRTLPPPFEATG